MTVAINLTHLTGDISKDLFFRYFEGFAGTRLHDKFIFIVSKNYVGAATNPTNILIEASGPKANNIFFLKVWYAYTLPSILKKHSADLLINGGGVCSFRTKIKQVIFLNEWYLSTGTPWFTDKQVRFLKKNAFKFLNKAVIIIAGSQFQKEQITSTHKIAEQKIQVLQLGVSELYRPLNFTEKETIKETWSAGKEYFLFFGEIHQGNNLVNLLKAFSFFKVRQKSNMQLLVLSNTATTKNPFTDILKTYKYRNEVKLVPLLPEAEIPGIVAAAYAFVYPARDETFPTFPLCALQCEVPLILSDTHTLKEMAGEAALYVDANNFQDIAAKMMLLFKDENERDQLIRNGKLLTPLNQSAQSHKLLSHIINDAFSINRTD